MKTIKKIFGNILRKTYLGKYLEEKYKNEQLTKDYQNLWKAHQQVLAELRKYVEVE
jgi:hypothetical protein